MPRVLVNRVSAVLGAAGMVAAAGCGHGTYFAGIVAGGGPAGAVAMLTTPSGASVRLEGELAEELGNVPGALVRVQGRDRGRGERHRLKVTDYRLIDAGRGAAPHVGRLYWDGTRLLLVEDHGGAVVELRGKAVATLRRQTGARAWVVGPVIDVEILEVFDYGILRAAR